MEFIENLIFLTQNQELSIKQASETGFCITQFIEYYIRFSIKLSYPIPSPAVVKRELIGQ